MAQKERIVRKKEVGVDMLAFSSIMTIMLAFFIMLTSFISDQEAELLKRASASFRKAVSSFGLNSFIERIGGKDVIDMDVDRSRQNFPAKPIENIHRNKDDNNVLEENVEFENNQQQTQSYIPTLIKFDKGDYNLNAEAKRILDDFILLVADRPSNIMVEGRAGSDEVAGSEDYLDWYLSSFRAHTVAEYLNSVGGIDARRLSAVGYGMHRPLVNQSGNAFVGLIVLQSM